MKPSTAKALGRKGQKDIVDMELNIFKDMLLPGDIISRPMGSNGEDILMSPKAIKLLPFAQEVKVGESIPITIYNYYQQAVDHVKSMKTIYTSDMYPIVHVHKLEDKRLKGSKEYPFLSIIKTEDLLTLLRRLSENVK